MTSGNDTEKCRETIHTLPLRISKKSIFSLYEKSEDFRNTIDDGDYIYLDGLFVLRPLATLFIKNGLDINDYIKKMASVGLISGAADYCLAIESVYVPYPYDPNVLRHSAGYVKSERIIHAAKRGALKDITKDEFEGVLSDENEPANDYTTWLRYFMKQKNVTDELLEELTGIPDRTIRGIRNTPDRRPKLEYAVAICLGLGLRPSESEKLLNVAGYCIRQTKKEKAYRYLIDCAYEEGVYECNRFLERMGFEPLTSL